MARYTVQLVSRVPIFADLIVEADSDDDAKAIVEHMRAAADEQLTSIRWTHGEGAEHPINFELDAREVAEIEVQHVEKIDERRLRIAAFYAEHGEAWGVIENAGYVGETDTGGIFESQSAAWAHVNEQYDPEEREQLRIDVPHWDADGAFWSYDH